MPKFAKYVLKNTAVAGETGTVLSFYFVSTDDLYDGITEAECGVDKVTDVDEKKTMPACTVEELLLSGQAVRRKLRLDVAGVKPKYKHLIVAKTKAATFDEAIIGKTVGGGVVVSSYAPLSRKYK